MNELFYRRSPSPDRCARISSRSFIFAICLTLVASVVGFAQGTRGTIRGDVTDQNGAAVAGATVKLVNTARKQEVRTATSDENGTFQMLEVEPATYEVVITASGFSEAHVSSVTVEPNRNVRLDPIQLGVA